MLACNSLHLQVVWAYRDSAIQTLEYMPDCTLLYIQVIHGYIITPTGSTWAHSNSILWVQEYMLACTLHLQVETLKYKTPDKMLACTLLHLQVVHGYIVTLLYGYKSKCLPVLYSTCNTRVHRESAIQDTRVHACLYFIAPTDSAWVLRDTRVHACLYFIAPKISTKVIKT